MTGQTINELGSNSFVPVIVKVDNFNQVSDIKNIINTNLPARKPINISSLSRKFPRKTLQKTNILMNIYQSRKDFAEFQTSRAVEKCQKKIEAEMEQCTIISALEVEEIYLRSERILREELFARFKFDLPISMERVTISNLENIFSIINQYQKIKKRTLFITALVEEWNRQAWSQTIPTFIENPSVSRSVSQADFSSFLLNGLGISTALEKRELNDEMILRVNGALKAIMIGISQKVKSQAAQVLY
ncbi:MAG: hypothetical protein ACYCVD_12875 [Desulfitobacteriaceae bacterium]